MPSTNLLTYQAQLAQLAVQTAAEHHAIDMKVAELNQLLQQKENDYKLARLTIMKVRVKAEMIEIQKQLAAVNKSIGPMHKRHEQDKKEILNLIASFTAEQKPAQHVHGEVTATPEQALQQAQDLIRQHKIESEAEHHDVDNRLDRIQTKLKKLKAFSPSDSATVIHGLEKQKEAIMREINPMHAHHEEIKQQDARRIAAAEKAIKDQAPTVAAFGGGSAYIPDHSASATFNMLNAIPALERSMTATDNNSQALASLAVISVATLMLYRKVRLVAFIADSAGRTVYEIGNSALKLFDKLKVPAPQLITEVRDAEMRKFRV
jgi:hypothetical protein